MATFVASPEPPPLNEGLNPGTLVAFDLGRGPWTMERVALQRQLLLEAADFLEFMEVSVLDEMEQLVAQLKEATDGRSEGAEGIDDVSAS